MPRTKRRHPFKRAPLNTPGESLVEYYYVELMSKAWLWATIVGILLAFAVFEWVRWFMSALPRPILFTVLALLFAIIGAIKLKRLFQVRRRICLAIEGEKTVAECLDPLKTAGYYVFHDIVETVGRRTFNIDHVLIGPTGVYVIETKARSKPVGRDARVVYDGQNLRVDGSPEDRDPIVQVKALADHVRGLLNEHTDIRPRIRPVVLFPGWFVERKCTDEDVWVLEPKAFTKWIANDGAVLDPSQVKLLAGALALHARPTYAT